MATLATAHWYVRPAVDGGADTNGGGFDAGIAGAGTNYADAASPILSLTDVACTNTTTLTSATGGFTTAMIGNAIRITGGTNFTAGYYWITARTDTNTVTLDRNPTNGSNATGGTAKVGGAFANLSNLSTGATPASQLSAGNTIWLRGSGTDNPTANDYSDASYRQFTAGSSAAGKIRLRGHNGRPRISATYGVWLYQLSWWKVENLFLYIAGASPDPNSGFFNGGNATQFENIYVENNGFDCTVFLGTTINCRIINTGSTAAGTRAAIILGQYGQMAWGNYIKNPRGFGINVGSNMCHASYNVIDGARADGILFNGSGGSYQEHVTHNTILNGARHGIQIGNVNALSHNCFGNLLVNNANYGINLGFGSLALNDRSKGIIDRNAFYGNGSGRYDLLSDGANDVTLSGSPFVNSAAGDYSLNDTAGAGLACRAVGMPPNFGGIDSYVNIGAANYAAGGGGGSPSETSHITLG